MPAFITADQYAKFVDVNRVTARRRLSHLTPNVPGGKLPLAGALPTIREAERGAVPQLCASAEVLPHMYVGDVIAPTVHALERWLTPDQARRLFACRVAFTRAMASLGSADFFLFHERLRMALVLNEVVLFYVLGMTTADTLPNWSLFAPAFSICNAREEDLLNISNKEAA
ncbi:MAG: hypothetical protein ACOH2M_19320 [Cypionkella sp.]